MNPWPIFPDMNDRSPSHTTLISLVIISKVSATHKSLMQVQPTVKGRSDGGVPVVWETAENGKTINVKSTTAKEWLRIGLIYRGLDSYMCVPLRADNRVVGVIEVVLDTYRVIGL